MDLKTLNCKTSVNFKLLQLGSSIGTNRDQQFPKEATLVSKELFQRLSLLFVGERTMQPEGLQ